MKYIKENSCLIVLAVFFGGGVSWYGLSRSPTIASSTPSSLTRLHHEMYGNIYRDVVADFKLNALRDHITGFSFRDPCKQPRLVQHAKSLVTVPFDSDARTGGLCWPMKAVSMAGRIRLDNIRNLLTAVIEEGVPGGFLEAGVWRGGCSIFAKGVLDVYKQTSRRVFVCDSFDGLPPASTAKDYDEWSIPDYLRVRLTEVQGNFRAYDLLDDNVYFVKGFFNESMPKLRKSPSLSNLAVLRMDGDMYESTFDILFNLYDKVSVGGYIIVDDWSIHVARRACKDFRNLHGIVDDVIPIDTMAAFWRKTRHVDVKYNQYLKFNKGRDFHVRSELRVKAEVMRTMRRTRNSRCRRWPFPCDDEFEN